MKRFVVLETTNGEGYTEPKVSVFDDYNIARQKLHSLFGQYALEDELEIDEISHKGNKISFYSTDEDGTEIDNYAINLIEISGNTNFVINTNFADEIEISKNKRIDEVIADKMEELKKENATVVKPKHKESNSDDIPGVLILQNLIEYDFGTLVIIEVIP